MVEVKQEKNFVCVTVKMEKRMLAKEPKKFFYTKDALEAAKKELSNVKFKDEPLENHVVSNCKGIQEATWKFPLVKEEKRQLKLPEKRAMVKEDTKAERSVSVNVDKKTE